MQLQTKLPLVNFEYTECKKNLENAKYFTLCCTSSEFEL